MAELTPDIETVPESKSSPSLSGPPGNRGGMGRPNVQSAAMKMEKAKEAYKGYAGNEEKPASVEVWSWYFYEFCSYFIQSVLMPVVFPLIMSQTVSSPPAPEHGASFSSRGSLCTNKEIILYQRLTQRSIPANNPKLSPLEWTSISWAIGLLIVAPILSPISFHLDHGKKQPLLAATAIGIGGIFCLPVGFFKTPWTFLPYFIAIVAAHTIASTCHTRHLGLMIRGFTGPFLRERQFPIRRAISGWLSVYATTAGCMGSATIAAFAFYMLREAPNQEFISLWVVSIFGGLQWLVGILHVFTGANRTRETIIDISASPSELHAFSMFKYPHAIGSLAGVFLSSFSTMCVFTGGVLFLVGNLCLKPLFLLYIWLIYFIFPMFSLPLLQVLQPWQHLIKADAVKMQLLGFLLLTATTGTGFYFKEENWEYGFVLFFAAVHSTSTGLLHAFGRVLLLDCSPSGKEGAFSIWYSWVKALGTFMGFAVVSIAPGKIATSFGITFWTAMVGIVLLIFGNISDFGGALAAKNVGDDSAKGSPVRGMDTGVLQNREFAEGETP